MSSDVRWLTAKEERLWRRWLTLNARLSATLHKELHDDAGLSMPDYEILVHLTDNPQGRIRVTDLARLLQWERSHALVPDECLRAMGELGLFGLPIAEQYGGQGGDHTDLVELTIREDVAFHEVAADL